MGRTIHYRTRRVLDLKLATYDILGSIAHSKMLAKVGLMSEEEQKQLHEALIRLYEKAEKGELVIEEGLKTSILRSNSYSLRS
jgi:argininosuccinate lyase